MKVYIYDALEERITSVYGLPVGLSFAKPGNTEKINPGITIRKIGDTLTLIQIILELIPLLWEIWLSIKAIWSKEARTIKAGIKAARNYQTDV